MLLLIPDHILHAVYSFVYPYFVLGYLANKYKITKRFVHNHILLFATSILYLTLLAFYNKDSYVYISGQCINRLNGIQFFVLDIYRFVTGITGCVFILVVIYWYYNSCRRNLIISSNIVMKFFTVLGNYSIGIYCFQDLLFNIYIRSIMPLINDSASLNYMSTTITLFTVLILSITLTFLLRKNKYTNIIFLGDRQ